MTNYILSLSNARRTFRNLKFIRDLSNGQQKAVFQVQNPDGKTLCLKVIPSTHESDRFKREIEISNRIQSKYMARVLEHGEIPQGPGAFVACHYFLEEFITGLSLKVPFAEEVPPYKIYRIISELCLAVSDLEHHQVIHRDIKPANVRLRNGADPVLIDFGSAYAKDLTRLTQVGQEPLGTLLYMSYEQLEKLELNSQSDLFSVGVIAFEALTEQHPFYLPGMADWQYKSAVKNEAVQKNELFQSLSSEVQALLLNLLSRDWRVRQSAAQAAENFKQYSPPEPSSPPLSDDPNKRNAAMLLTSLFVILPLYNLKITDISQKSLNTSFDDGFFEILETAQSVASGELTEDVFLAHVCKGSINFFSEIKVALGEVKITLAETGAMLLLGYSWRHKTAFEHLQWPSDSYRDIAFRIGEKIYNEEPNPSEKISDAIEAFAQIAQLEEKCRSTGVESPFQAVIRKAKERQKQASEASVPKESAN